MQSRTTELSHFMISFQSENYQSTAKFCEEDAHTPYLLSTKAQCVTGVGLKRKGSAPQSGCIGLLVILNGIHNNVTDR